jgi:hypothetical protein
MQTAGTAKRTKGGRPGIPDTWRPAAATAASASPAADATTAKEEETASTPGTSDGDPVQDEHPDNGHPGDGTAPDAQGTGGEPSQDGTAETAALGDGDDDEHLDDNRGAERGPDPAVAATVAAHVGKIGFAAEAVTTALEVGISARRWRPSRTSGTRPGRPAGRSRPPQADGRRLPSSPARYASWSPRTCAPTLTRT